MNCIGDQVFASRFEALGDVDLLGADTEFRPLVPSIFGGMTGLFIIIVVISHARGHKKSLTEARLVFTRYGRLTRPSVIGGDEFEAILRGFVEDL